MKITDDRPVNGSPEIAAELEKIELALREPQTDERYMQLYAAQQALAWAMNPNGFASPFATIQRGLVRPLTGDIQEDSAGYPGGSRPPRSSGSHALPQSGQ
jgi:hypothetical protein